MTKFVITPDVALKMARENRVILAKHKLLAPALFRSQVLSLCFCAAGADALNEKEALRQLNFIRKLPIRMLGDRSLQDNAWKIAAQLGHANTLDAEYLALTKLQADALITLDKNLARSAKGIVRVAPFDALF